MESLLSHIRRSPPWLTNVSLKGLGENPCPPPAWLHLGFHALTATEQNPIVLVAPQPDKVARWSALVFALDQFRLGYPSMIERAGGCPLEVGCRVVIDEGGTLFAFRYLGLDDEGRQLLGPLEGNAFKLIGCVNPLRLRRQEKGGKAGKSDSLKRQSASHPIASLLGADPFGNADLIRSQVVLIDSLSHGDTFLRSVGMSRSDARPSASDSLETFDAESRLIERHRTASAFLAQPSAKIRRWVIINGFQRLESCTEIPRLMREHNVLVVSSSAEAESHSRYNGGPDFWHLYDDAWVAEGGADSASRCMSNLGARQWDPCLLRHASIEKAARHLANLCRSLDESDETAAQKLRKEAWSLLLEASNRTRGYSDNQRRDWTARVQKFGNLKQSVRTWLSREQDSEIDAATSLLVENAALDRGLAHPKGSELYALADSSLKTAVLVRSEGEAISVRARLEARTSNCMIASAASFDPDEAQFDQLIICGWLGCRTMTSVLVSGCAPKIVLLGYGFEMAWLRSLVARIERRGGVASVDGLTKLEIVQAIDTALGWPPVAPPLAIKWHHAAEPPAETESEETPIPAESWLGVDVWDFERRLENHRKAPLLGVQASIVDAVAVRYVSFAGLGYGFFTEDYRLRIISAKGERMLTSKAVDQLREGDLAVFPFIGGSDVITEVANHGLGDNADRLRIAANNYSSQLKSSRLSADEFHRRAISHGFTKKIATVRQWYDGSRVIGPDDDHDIEIIQQVVGGQDWARQCIEARRKLRAAHSEAEGRIRTALLRKLETEIDTIEAEGGEVHLGELGSVWVQCVESVARDFESRSRSQCNHLLWED